MKILFVSIRIVNCILTEVETLFQEFEALHVKVTTATNNSYGFIEKVLSQVEKGEEDFMKEQSKSKIYEFLNVHYKEFFFSTHLCAIDYLKDIHAILAKHISEIKTGNLNVEYYENITQSHGKLMEDKGSFEKCTKELEEFAAANKEYALLEIIVSEHKLLFLTAMSHCQFLNLQQLEFMRKGKELAGQILQKLGDFIIRNGNSFQTVEQMSLDEI